MNFRTTGRIIKGGTAPERPLPSVPQLAANATKAAARNVAALLSGQRFMADEEARQKRLSICGECEFFRHSDERCSHKNCGCRLRLKTWLQAERCPAGKW